jgi:DNA repair protein RecO (recombination protein O)
MRVSLETTPAILLRKTRFGDTSLIITWFTQAHGRLKTVVKGALRPKSKFAGVLDLFFECEISFARSAKSELHTLREAALRDAREGLRRDYARVALASYFVELIETATEPEHTAPEIFDLLLRALRHLDEKPASRRALLHFETELVKMLGIQHPRLTPIVAFGRAYHRIPNARPGLLKMLPGAETKGSDEDGEDA